ncbi:2Fe-2S iron-sulfur cluster-binding protein [Gemmatimonas sp.]|jgi:isoquinoline 1-oxidoreductase alpha subunit
MARIPLQQTWRRIDVPQCGFCQSGKIIQAATLLAPNP